MISGALCACAFTVLAAYLAVAIANTRGAVVAPIPQADPRLKDPAFVGRVLQRQNDFQRRFRRCLAPLLLLFLVPAVLLLAL